MGESGGWECTGEGGIWGEGERAQGRGAGAWEEGDMEGVADRLGVRIWWCWGEDVGRGEQWLLMGGPDDRPGFSGVTTLTMQTFWVDGYSSMIWKTVSKFRSFFFRSWDSTLCRSW